MVKMVSIAAFLVWQLTCAAWAAPSENPITLITPPDKAVVRGALISVALRIAPDAVDSVQVLLNNRKVPFPKKQYQQQTVCIDGLGLYFGLNRIKVIGLKGGNKVGEVSAVVFYRSDLSSSSSSPPDGFTKYLFHTQAREKGCMPCHQLEFSAFEGGDAPAEKSPCYRCHKKLLSNYQTVHGPAAVWSCLNCHDQKASQKLAVVQPDNKMCDNCHENSWGAMKFGHGPTAAGSCATCHDPHASDQPFFLRMSGGDLCAGCHEEILQKPHVIVGFSNNGHPLRKSPDPYHPTKNFSCISCHNPHAGSSWTFLNGYDGVSPISTFCRTCHAM